ncbi:MAG TPA: site-specific integrase [Ignavibacteria bacterium]|nr:site-specific integrase [Ignavibacteria bacterium]
MKIYLRKRPLQNGLISLYLEYYKGYSKSSDGKIKHHRKKENLNLYLHSNPKNSAQRNENKEVEFKASKILTLKQADVINNKFGFDSEIKSKITLMEYFLKLTNERENSKGNYGNWNSTSKHLMNFLTQYYNPDTFLLKNVTPELVNQFKEFLLNIKTKSNTDLSDNSKHSYFNKFKACVRQGFEEKLIKENPLRTVKGIKAGEPVREYLTLEEVKNLAITECRYDQLKKAFLFSCLTGLRWSDIQKLRWSEIQSENGNFKIIFKQQKTKGLEYLDVPNQAIKILGEFGELNERVFKGLKYSSYINVELTKWCLKAGITKDITFHSARHTFATLQLTLGTDITIVQKLLGHKNLSTTMIYAKVIDVKKREAVNKIPEIQLIA